MVSLAAELSPEPPDAEQKNSGWIWDLTFRGKALMSFFVKPTQDGMVLGFAAEELGDVHLTVYSKDGKIFAHVTDRTRPDKPWSQYFDNKLLSAKAERAAKRWVKPYTTNKPAWIMTPFLRRRLASTFQQEEGRMRMPLEAVAGELVFDRDNPKRWRRLRIRDLLTTQGAPGLAVVDDRLCWVIPLDHKSMLAFTERQFERYWNMISRELGLDKYLEYVSAAYPQLQKKAAEKVKTLSGRPEK